MIMFSIFVIIGYFIFFVYVYLLVLKVQNALYDKFQKEAIQHFGTNRSYTLNPKTGILFLWADNIKEISKRDKNIERLRQKAATCIIILLFAIILMPASILMAWWLVWH